MSHGTALKNGEYLELDRALTHPDPRWFLSRKGAFVFRPGPASSEIGDVSVNFKPHQHWPVDVACTGTSRWLRGDSVERHHSVCFAVELVLEGQGRLDVAHSHYELLPGDIFILHPHEHHRYCAVSRKPFLKMYVDLHWEPKAKSDALTALGFMGVSHIRLGSSDVPRVRKLFEALHEAARRESPDAHERASVLAYNLLMVIAHFIACEEDKLILPQPIARALQSTQGDANAIPDSSRMVSAAGCCAKHLNRLFVKHLGMRMHEWVMRRKLSVAVHYLTTTRSKVHEIAMRLGYKDPFSFSRAFHYFMDTTPTEFRHNYKHRNARQKQPDCVSDLDWCMGRKILSAPRRRRIVAL